jgi:hypothetical protein
VIAICGVIPIGAFLQVIALMNSNCRTARPYMDFPLWRRPLGVPIISAALGSKVSNCTNSYCVAAVAKTATRNAIAALSQNNGGILTRDAKGRIPLVQFTVNGFNNAMKRVEP